MEWEPVTYEDHKDTFSQDNPPFLKSGESTYAIFRKDNQKYLVYVANITEEKCESIVDVQELVHQRPVYR